MSACSPARPALTVILALTAALFAMTTFAHARDRTQPTTTDETEVHNCLEASRDAGKHATACIGVASRTCQSDPAMGTTGGMMDCFARENAVWDDLLNTYYQDLQGALSSSGKKTLRDIQRTWIGWRDQKCKLPYSIFEGGSIARPMEADCIMQTTAMRAIELARDLDAATE